jgi:glucose-6-phosphate isomerase
MNCYGANEMDDHFKTADFDQNMPVVLALLSIIISLELKAKL